MGLLWKYGNDSSVTLTLGDHVLDLVRLTLCLETAFGEHLVEWIPCRKERFLHQK